MKNQRGFTLTNLFVLLFFMGFGAYVTARLLPAYMDYWTIERALRNIVEEPEVEKMKERDIRQRFGKDLHLNNVDAVSEADLVIEQIPEGLRLSISYSVKEPFMGEVSLCMDFEPEASSK
ncbi:MAG: DUF4845 domain-containing protein [Pseudomonadota bacterium]